MPGALRGQSYFPIPVVPLVLKPTTSVANCRRENRVDGAWASGACPAVQQFARSEADMSHLRVCVRAHTSHLLIEPSSSLGAGDSPSPRCCSSRCSACTTWCLPCFPLASPPSTRSCLSCASVPSRYVWQGAEVTARLRSWLTGPFSLQGLVVAVLYCFLNSEVSPLTPQEPGTLLNLSEGSEMHSAQWVTISSS